MNFIERKFNIPALQGISQKAIDEHLKLYAGYVKHANLIAQTIENQSKESTPEIIYANNEMRRRFAFEFDGIRNHEYFFEQFEGGSQNYSDQSPLVRKISETWGDVENWKKAITDTALTRGIGWAILYFDPQTNQLINAWVDEQHFGHLTGLRVIVALDIWEHAYLFDYIPSEKKNYIEALFENINWSVIEKRFN